MKKTEKEKLESRELEMTSTEAGEALQAGGEEVAGPVGEKNGSGEESFDSEKNTETPSEPSDQPKKKSMDLKGSLNTKNVRYGSYSAALSAIVIVIAVVVNLIASVLPSGIQSADLSPNKIYSIGKQTEKGVRVLGPSPILRSYDCHHILGGQKGIGGIKRTPGALSPE